ncbi:MAG: prephenate dehydratase [Acidobacteria bacterium]|nr:prephenate dehydratase [Acidobacteriota bacterium]
MPRRNSLRVAFQGERGAYSEIAARLFFGKAIELLPCESFDLVFKSVEGQKARSAIVPIENSQAGCIHQNYDLLLKHRLRIVGELNLRVEHSLIAHPGATLKSIRRVFSHPQALMQCQGNTAKLKDVKIIPAYDTAGSVKKIKEDKLLDAAAIASELAAKTYGMKILKRQIQDNPENFTRFLVLRKTVLLPAGANKTSLVFSVKNVPGALFRSLSAFALRDIDLYKIESRPLHGKPWEYFFYIDFAGSPKDRNCRNALAHLGEIASFMKVLGSYPRDSRQL